MERRRGELVRIVERELLVRLLAFTELPVNGGEGEVRRPVVRE